MSISIIDIFAAGAAIVAVWMCGVTGMAALQRLLGIQAGLLAAMTALLGMAHGTPHYYLLAAVVLGVKAIAIPVYLSYAAARLQVHRDDGVQVPGAVALFLGFGLLVVGYFIAPVIGVPRMGYLGAAGMAVTLLLTGMLLMLTRRLALSQVIGFLVLENGIFLYSLTQTHGMPMVIEMGVVFDVLIAVLVAGVVIFRMNRSFEHIDVTQLRGLRH
jgi:hydrogenase-4 component E